MRRYRIPKNTIEGERLRERLCAFMAANGIPTGDVPVDGNVIVVRLRSITTDVLVRDHRGLFVADLEAMEHVRERRTFPRTSWVRAPRRRG